MHARSFPGGLVVSKWINLLKQYFWLVVRLHQFSFFSMIFDELVHNFLVCHYNQTMVEFDDTLVIGIAGGTGSGKDHRSQ